MTHDYNIPHTAKTSALHRALLLAICFILSFTTTSLAQTIGGNVFGGGNQGDVNKSSTVELRGGIIQGDVFGGGNEAEVKSSTSVTISGGELKRNVYGAGNQGNVGSSSTVKLYGGTIMGNVYGGAREADVAGRTFVDVNATSTLLVSGVYGGNDVSGTIGKSGALPFTPSLLDVITTEWNSFVRIANNTYPVIIGSLYGGGNGAYDVYTSDKKKPELGKTYLEIQGGIFGNIYGGGNNATVTGNTVIYMNNQLANLSVSEATLGDFKDLFDATDYSTNGENVTFKHHVSRMFGGNNLAEMAIRPTWNLIKGSINNLYSGGNRGAMTSRTGILLPLTSADLTVNNVYGGCRIADVNPGTNAPGEDKTIQDYTFPAGYATRVYITAGNITNVYGGNDISGKVHYGTNLAIFSNIKGDVYGGGNGSYAYTDNSAWVTAHPEDADYYYDPSTSSIDALFNFRPHIEKTLIHVVGNDANNPITLGSVYCGGNSATLYNAEGNAAATFHIGKNVTIGNVFLGSNGANMVSSDIATKYAREENSVKFSSISLANGVVARYMDGVDVNIVPTIEWENDLDYSTRIGSFFCGGNVGSMTYDGVAKTGNNNLLIFPAGITITDKIVAGCNNASIIQGGKVIYEGGLVGAADDAGDKVRIKVLSRLEPNLSENTVKYQDAEGAINESKIYQGANVYGGCYQSGVINGNVVIDVESDIMAPNLDTNILTSTGDYIDASALAIYGGGYGADAVIKGNTEINLTKDARVLFVFGGGEMGEVTGNTTVNLDANLNFTTNQNAYKVYAGGYAGPVGGNTTLKLLGGSVMSAFAGACNANIGGTTEVIIGTGTSGVPYVTHAVYGGNDFGGHIGGHIGVNNTSSKLYENITVPDGTKNVRTQTYVKYVSGKIGRAIYGGSYGSYAYNNQDIYGTLTNHTYPTIYDTVSKQDDDPEGTILTNTFVDIASTSNSAEDVIGSENSESVLTMLAGGGRGYKGLPEHVEVGQTYLLLRGASYSNRNKNLMAHRVYGGGNLSKVGNTRIDAYSGSFGAIFGGTHGVKTESSDDLAASYDCTNTEIHFYSDMDNADMNLYGTGANSGATGTATINLYGGKVYNVYGGSLAEGYTKSTVINVPYVPDGPILRANAIFGGALGESAGRPCDVGTSTVTFASTKATVEDGIYGGNHTARATESTNVIISVPVKSQSDIYQNVFGAGYGVGTVAGFTNVTLEPGAEVANVYGGGRDGQVYNAYNKIDIQGPTVDGNETKITSYPETRYAAWSIGTNDLNTKVEIKGDEGNRAYVMQNAYGAAWGENADKGLVANTCGKTKVYLNGGVVNGDIYGGGYAGKMLSLDDSKNYDEHIATHCVINGGDVRNVFGGGYKGDIEGNTQVTIGNKTGTSFFNGVPTILRSAYGGGEMAEVTGTATVDMYNGYIGYRYDILSTATREEDKYQPELKLNADDEANLLSENGNLYGAGFGEGAVVMQTKVSLYGGTVRNGVYGGGEIAAVGDAKRNDNGTFTEIEGGQTNVYMYGGLVVGDIFGGGRGYSYDLTGNQVIGKTLYSDGYVFGKTNVEIYRGTIGTDESLRQGHGNVFGGGNIGYVYSAGVKYTGDTNGTMIKGHYYTDNTYSKRTEDCRVHIAAGSYVKSGSVTINDTLYNSGDFLPNRLLNTLTYDDLRWARLDDSGVTIRNAVFAGGNVSAGSDKVYANAVTVFGNATAAVVDVFSRDLVTLGGEHIGGLYGDGNLTFVDGYRELNITNYGTDYYHLNPDNTKKIITQTDYDNLSAREKAYFTAEKGENEAIQYTISRTSGRMMNTIQRADFCGVLGCRILLHGAQDRVPDVADYTNYTINRVGEVSLNCVTPQGIKSQDNTSQVDASQNEVVHGNYFGIYNVVNLLGALTSDVEFTSNRKASKYTETTGNSATELTTSESYIPGRSYYDFKDNNYSKGFRNKANSLNMVALASGVYLELVEEEIEEKQTGEVTKTYGPITGVIELDLINVRTGEGGGYVYAKNEHRKPQPVDAETKKQQTLSTANQGAITQKAFTYTEVSSTSGMQTSGNFVHDDYRIVDDCFPNGGDIKSPAHFWYVIGNYYVYDQKLSAYTGGANAYEQSINIPFTITDGSNGKVQITSIKPNKYFVGAAGVTSYKFGGKEYHLNDIISYWDWTQLPLGETGPRSYFVDMTYIAQSAAGNYQPGDVISATTYNDLSPQEKQAFRISNEMSHDNGYLLTYGMTNPLEWDTYFTIETPEKDKVTKLLGSDFEKLSEQDKEKYLQAPTIQCTESGIYGQRTYNSEDLVSQAVIEEHKRIAESTDQATKDAYSQLTNQAIFQRAYVATREILIGNASYNVGSYISYSVFDDLSTEQKTAFEEAYLCIRTIEVAEKDYVLNGELISNTRYVQLRDLTDNANDTYMYDVVITDHFSPAYVCVRQNPEDNDTYYYGGTYFEAGTNYSALDICALSHSDRQAKKTNGDSVFVFNKDALDLFYTDFSDDIKGYGSPYYEENQYLYVDFEATYTGNETSLTKVDGTSTMQIKKGDVLNREAYQQLLNEQAHYVKVTLLEGMNYIVKTQFKHNNTNYLVGTVLDSDTYESLGENNKYCYEYDNSSTRYTDAYFCREDYQSPNSTSVPLGKVIPKTEYDELPNYQKDFSIVGRASTETSTLYVPRESDIENLSKDRIITVQLEYVYNENGEEKLENHVVNIHVQFKSGQPTIGNVAPPATVLPNTTVGLSVPTVTPGAYEIIGGGWEIFKNENDARAHKNGATYRNNATPMYWYQNGYYVAYFAKTYLGKVYSNPVRFTIANYHRLSEVMNHKVGDKNEYMFIDHEHANRDRAPKIYLDAAGSESAVKNDLDYLADLYNATLQETTETTTNDAGENVSVTIREVEERIKGGANLEFILRSDIAPKAYSNWTPVGSETVPFAGTFHGNGYTISGLNGASLFGHLGGKVYNLGVNGGNVTSNLTNDGRIENVWVSTTGTSPLTSGDNVVNYHFLTNENAASFAKGEVAYTLNSFYAPNVQYNANGYVEKYFADGDFIYADGIIPLTTDVRYQNGQYSPLADDYIFFGQRLIYSDGHESLPNRINKVGNNIDRTETNGDRVYRTSAYYMDDTESEIFFNTAAKFVDAYDSKPIHHNLTAIDFTGSKKDMEQLLGFSLGDGLTRNLLVYAENVADNPTYGNVSSYLNETALSISSISDNNYKTVAKNESPSRGHLVTKQGNNYVALTDHFLVDKENFHVPIAYKFDSGEPGKRMWYQRTPDRFAVAGNGNGDGWDIICLPFTAELVTTHQKGEITHFYGDSKKMHEYWLRKLKEVSTTTSDGQNSTTATFASPSAVEGNSYTRYNDFLSDYYYSKYNDKNDDTYQDYYKNPETFAGYAYLQANTPYIIAFPGQSYHEFDMSGNFAPEHTATSIGKLDKQVVTFVSEAGAEIGVTDDATLDKTAGGYDFVGTYQTKDINGYLLNAEGSAFVEANAQSSIPFRGYLTTTPSGAPKRIFISSAAEEEEEPAEDVIERGLTIYGKNQAIYIESTLEHEATLTIFTMSGQLVKRITLQPMSKEVIPVTSRGIYIVNNKKVSVL